MRCIPLFIVCACVAGCETPARDTERLAREIRETTPPPDNPGIIPFTELPGPGECRIWYPGRSPIEQPEEGPCDELDEKVPPGAWLIYRPAQQPQLFEVREYPVNPRGEMVVGIYDARTGAYLGRGAS